MKSIFNHKLFFTLLIVSVLIISCEKFLEEDTYGLLTPEATIKTPEDIRAAVDAIYAKLKSSHGSRYSILSINWLASEIVSTRMGGSEGLMDEYKLEVTNELLDNVFQASYEGIKRANTVVDYIDGITFNSENEKNELLAEARFMRAFQYFNLVRLFGAVPKYMSVPKNPDEVHVPRSSVNEIYGEIILPDLEFSITNLPDVNGDGRTNKVASQMLLSKVYMTLEEWDNAINPILQVINNQNYGLVDNWADLWLDPNENKEIIFAIQYINLSGHMNTFSSNFGITTGGSMSNPIYYSEWPYYNNYPEGSRKDALFLTEHVEPDGTVLHIEDAGWAQGWHQPLFKCYLDAKPDVLGNGVDIPLLRFADALLMYAEIENEINGPSTEAYDAINKVRRRAAGVDINTPSQADLSGLSKSDFREAVFQERRWELPLEGHSLFDALRCGLEKFREVMASSEPVIGSILNPIEEYRLLLPFPAYEIQRNNNIDFSDQNPGY